MTNTFNPEISPACKALLEQTDWAIISDVPLTERSKNEFIEYRRIIRDLYRDPGNNIQNPEALPKMPTAQWVDET
jgi:hypothetical protein|tara:strand:- start:8 stop:232 length:225 start_codon:yes stop_codon:yes gene_type:complete